MIKQLRYLIGEVLLGFELAEPDFSDDTVLAYEKFLWSLHNDLEAKIDEEESERKSA